MNVNHTKKNKKAIAVTYSNKNNEKFQRQQLILLLSALCGLCFVLLSNSSEAAIHPQTITVDVKAPVEIDYSQVDEFHRAVDKNASQFAAKDGDQLIFSDKPIIIEKKLPQGYQPKSLADLGVRVSISNDAISDNIIRIPAYALVKDQLYLFSIPEVIVSEAAPVVTAEAASATAPTVIPETAPAADQPVAMLPVASEIQQNNIMKSASTTIESNLDISFWKILASAGLVLGALLLATRSRKSPSVTKPAIYHGQPSANEMVGKGKLFDFNGNVLNGKVTPINTTFLNMLWHVGKFSKEGSMNTYFYMAFYIPPQQDYAKTLQKQESVKKEEAHTD